MHEGITTLHQAVRPIVLGKYLGQLALVFALLGIPPLFIAIYYGEYSVSLRYIFLIPILILLFMLSRRLPTPTQLQQNEALTIIALAFLLSPLISSIVMHACGLTWGEALFESISAITTTGLTTLSGLQDYPHTFLFLRAWIQWYGGLGIVVFSIALMAGHHAASRRLAEPPAGEGVAITTRTYARHILISYATLTLIAITVLRLSGMGNFDALAHALSGVSTGGFSPYDNSLAHFSAAGPAIAAILIALAGATPLHLYYRFRQRGPTATLQDSELRTLLLLCLIIAATISLFLHFDGMPWKDAIYHGVVQGISAQSTTGFATQDIANLNEGSKLALIISMFIGGGLGSTAGGIKILRLLILLRLIQLMIQRTALPSHAVTEPRLYGKPLDEGDIQGALMLIILFIIVILASWLVFIGYGYAPLDALFEVVSASGTVGLSTGITSGTLEPVLRALLCLDMLLGRLEIVALLVVLYPPTWFAKRTENP